MEFMLNDRERHSTKNYWHTKEKIYKGHIGLRINKIDDISLLLQCRYSDGKHSSRKITLCSDTEHQNVWENLENNPYYGNQPINRSIDC